MALRFPLLASAFFLIMARSDPDGIVSRMLHSSWRLHLGKEVISRDSELETLSAGLGEVFIQRWDLYAQQLDDGRYICVHKPLTPRHLFAHLQGKITLGTYVLDQQSRARFIAFDADDDGQSAELVSLNTNLAAEGVPSYLENSRRGGHLWIFFSQPIAGREARLFGHSLLTKHGLDHIELFPKQDRLKSGPGSLIRLPFGVHRRTGRRYGFVTQDGQPLAPSIREQISVLCTPEAAPAAAVKLHILERPSLSTALVRVRHESRSVSVSQKIKDSISVVDFVGRFVELSPSGRGLCPFHDDHQASFSVNFEENYWHCFAGCGGGSVIDFWIKWRSCDFSDAVRELAQML